MQQEQLDRFERWFEDYTSRFFGDDKYVNANLRLKQEHTQRTRQEIRLLAEALMLDARQTHLAGVIALFHDIGRFPQFVKYRTYNDPKSVDHCRLGVEVLRQEGILKTLRREERQCVETAIELHGRKALPSDLKGQTLLLSKLIRDADKIDIFRVVIDSYKGYRKNPDGFLLEIELPDEPRYSPDVLAALLNQELIDYTKLRTLNDMKLCQLSWVYDMNFSVSLARLRHLGFVEQVLNFLPQTAEMKRVAERILGHLDARLSSTPY